jgi:hypothetical protein
MTRSWNSHKLNKKFCYWCDDALRLLEASAATVLKRSDDFSNFVEKEDLISEGWLRETRFSKSDTKVRNSFYNLVRSMKTAKRKCENPHYLTKSQPSFRGFTEVEYDSMSNRREGNTFINGIDVMDTLLSCCQDRREKRILAHRLEGLTHEEIGKEIGVSGSHVTVLLQKLYIRYEERTKKEVY